MAKRTHPLLDKSTVSVGRISGSVQELPETAVVPHLPVGTSPGSTFAKTVVQACCDLNLNDKPIGATHWSDGGMLAAAGIETVVIGPGDIGHGPNEAVPIAELKTAVQLYTDVALQLLV